MKRVVSLRIFIRQQKTKSEAQLVIRPNTKAMLYTTPYKLYLKESSMPQSSSPVSFRARLAMVASMDTSGKFPAVRNCNSCSVLPSPSPARSKCYCNELLSSLVHTEGPILLSVGKKTRGKGAGLVSKLNMSILSRIMTTSYFSIQKTVSADSGKLWNLIIQNYRDMTEHTRFLVKSK